MHVGCENLTQALSVKKKYTTARWNKKLLLSYRVKTGQVFSLFYFLFAIKSFSLLVWCWEYLQPFSLLQFQLVRACQKLVLVPLSIRR